ncbi:MFS transporter [Agromyces sp. SYSU T00266]|uniref:MFS transporter n=1 Tax=Agromyces zhanjiangensis TaxID=3158562 RepID=UPI00339AC75F
MVRGRASTWRVHPWWVAVVAGMASYVDALAIAGFAAAVVIYGDDLALAAREIGLAAGALSIGIAAGALVGGRLGDRLGRRPVFTATMVLIVVGAVGLFVASDFAVVVGAALLLGLGVGADLPVALATISEAARDDHRGKLLAFTNLLWVLGGVVGGALTAFLGDLGRPGAEVIFAHLAVMASLVLAARLTVPESERWLAARTERRRGIRTVRADRVRVRACGSCASPTRRSASRTSRWARCASWSGRSSSRSSG